MKEFAALIRILSASTKTSEKLDALSKYAGDSRCCRQTMGTGAFAGRRPKRTVNATQLSTWCLQMTGLPAWLYEECYHTVGDLAETIALLLPPGKSISVHPLHYWIDQLIQLEKAEEATKQTFILKAWEELDTSERFVFNKLITGGFRIGVSQKMMANALSDTYNIPAATISHMISGNWDPRKTTMEGIIKRNITADASMPFLFYLAYALETGPAELGVPEQWQAEWKWDGIQTDHQT